MLIYSILFFLKASKIFNLKVVKTVICDLLLDLDKKVAYDRGSLNTISIYTRKGFWADLSMVAYDRKSFNSGGDCISCIRVYLFPLEVRFFKSLIEKRSEQTKIFTRLLQFIRSTLPGSVKLM